MRKRRTQIPKSPEQSPTAVLYARVSTKEQESGYSIDAQLGLLRGYAAAKGFEVVEEFIEAETAKSSGRRRFADMVALVKARLISHIITEKTDRIYRNLKDRVVIDELGCAVHLVKENTVLSKDSRSHEKFMHDIKVVVAKNYCDNLSEEARKGMLEKARQGLWPTGAPIGYRNISDGRRRSIEPDPVRAAAVRLMFDLYATGRHSVADLRALAQGKGLVTRRGTTPAIETLHTMLRNPLYVGTVVWGGETYPGLHEPLVDRTTFDRVQEQLDRRHNNVGGREMAQFSYSGLIKCGKCGCTASPYVAKGKYIYYACSGARGCSRHGVREETITEAIGKLFDRFYIRPDVLAELRIGLRDSFALQEREEDQRLSELQAERQTVKKKLTSIYKDFLAGDVPRLVYDDLRPEWERQAAALEREIAAVERAGMRTWEDAAAIIEAVSNMPLEFKSADSGLRRQMAKIALSNFTIHGKTVELGLKTWFNLVLRANEETVAVPTGKGLHPVWWAVLDGLRTLAPTFGRP